MTDSAPARTAGRGRGRRRLSGFLRLTAALVLAGTVQSCVRQGLSPEETAPVASGGPLTETGGGGSTFPQRSLNDPWALSASRANCLICHSVDPNVNAFRFNGFGEDWREVLFGRIDPDADDIFDPDQQQREAASTDAELLALDSDGDGYRNRAELRFGTDPGDSASRPARPAPVLNELDQQITTALGDQDPADLEDAPEVQQAGPDTDGDAVADLLESFAGTDPADAGSTPITSARRLAVYRQLLLDAGVRADP